MMSVQSQPRTDPGLFLRDGIPWFGAHTGYEQLTQYLPARADWSVIGSRRGRLARYAGSTYARLHGRTGRGAADLSELEFRLNRRMRKPGVSHILYLEQHLDLLKAWTTCAPKDVIGTIHLPARVWKSDLCSKLSRLASALILYQRDISFFEQHVGKGRVRFVHHGVDTEFFKPDSAKIQKSARLLYSGVFLRNEPMLVRLIGGLLQSDPKLQFDLLVPVHHRKSPALAPLLNHPAVCWHAGLNDEELRALYQRSTLLLLPMNDSGANTAVVEALSSGLPIVTTDVGGIRDYGGGSLFPIVANNDDTAMIGLVEQYLTQPEWRQEMARRCRQFAEEILAWPLIAQKHLQIYQELTA